MIVIQQSFIPKNLGELRDAVGDLRSSWIEVHGPASAGRILVPYSGLPCQVIWEQHAENLEVHDERYRAWQRDAKTQSLASELDRSTRDSQHRIFTVIGD